tara:strand:- start:207 stop:872 length:666 start_codon:yes stop_codon:yes gene_type:complete
MNDQRKNDAPTNGRIFRAEYESRFGNMPEFGSRVLCGFAETFDAVLWVPVLDDLAMNEGFSTRRKPMIHDIEKSLARVVARKTAAVAKKAPRTVDRGKTPATPEEVSTIIAATESGGAELSAWISDARRLAIAVRPGAIEIIANAFRVSIEWAQWTIDQLDAGVSFDDIREKLDPVIPDDPTPKKKSNIFSAFAASASNPDRPDALRSTRPDGRPVRMVDR